jgi:hypothetical protein
MQSMGKVSCVLAAFVHVLKGLHVARLVSVGVMLLSSNDTQPGS